MTQRNGREVRREPLSRLPRQMELFGRKMSDRGLTGIRKGPFGPSDDHAALAFGLQEIYPRVPDAVICMTTAAYLQDLLPHPSMPVWIGVPLGVHVPKWDQLRLQAIRWSNDPAFNTGVELIEYRGVTLTVTNRERTIIDLVHYGRRLGSYAAAARSLFAYRANGGRQADVRSMATCREPAAAGSSHSQRPSGWIGDRAMMAAATSTSAACQAPKVVAVPPAGDPIRRAEEIVIASLAASHAAKRFPLHGAWAVGAWLGGLPRPTRGIDLIDLECGSVDGIVACLGDAIGSCPGGLTLSWPAPQVRTKAARRSPLYRLTIPARLRHRSFDLGINVTAARDPAPRTVIRSLHAPPGCRPISWVTCCTAEEIVAEKAALLVTYGADHTRLQDIFDLWLLSQRIRLDDLSLIEAMTTTFTGRDASRMLKRDDGYWEGAFDPTRFGVADLERWYSLTTTGDASNGPPPLSDAVQAVGRVLRPLLLAVRDGISRRLA